MKVLIAGDFCPKDRISDLIETSNYHRSLESVKELTKNADYSILNLECPIVDNPAAPIVKCGPNLKCSKKTTEVIRWMGFDAVTLANNHFFDYGEEGVRDTLAFLQTSNIDYVGGGINLSEASKPLVIDKNGVKLGIVNCCEHEFSIAKETGAGSNPLNVIKQYYSIKESRKEADYVIVIVHGGFEHFEFPSLRMQETYRFFIEAGADAVVNHHQHCYSGFEIYKKKPIFYGLGNFCFDWNGKRNTKWNEGYIVELDLGTEINYRIFPYEQCNNEPIITFNIARNLFDKRLNEINSVINNEVLLKEVNERYLNDEYEKYIFCFEPFYNKFTSSLFFKGLIPSFIKRRRPALIDYIGNESHYEKVLAAIDKTRR